MNDQPMTYDELRERMAEHLGDELTAEQRTRFEASLEAHPDLGEEIRSLRRAMRSMQMLESEPQGANVKTSEVPRHVASGLSRGHLMRFAAMIALAFLLGYIVRGLDPGDPADSRVTGLETLTPSGLERVEDSAPERSERANVESRGTRFAVHYLSDAGRSGLSRSLIAYARATKKRIP